MAFKKNSTFQASRIAVVSVFVVLFLCALVLIGWLFEVPLLQSLSPNWPSIKANTAIGMLFCGISLFLFIKKRNRVALFFAAMVFLLSILSFSEHIFKFNAHIDELLFTDKGSSTEQNHGRMPLLASVVLMFTSISLFLYPIEKKWVQRIWQFLVIVIFTLCFAGFIGALLNTGQFFKSQNLAAFSIPATFTGLLVTVGIISSKPGSRILTVFQSNTIAAKASLRGIFFIIAILVVIGWLCLEGVDAGLFNMPIGFVIMISTFTVSFLIITLTAIQRLNQSETQLIASEKDLRHVLSSTADVFYVVDKSYTITLINDMAERNLARAWGKTVKNGINILDVIPDDKNEPIRKSFEKVFKGEKVEYELHQLKWKDLPEWVLVTYNPVVDNDGTVIGVYVVTKNITKSKKAEEGLKQSNNRFELISRTTNDAIWEWNLETGQLWSNATHQELYGLSMNDPVPTEKMWAERIHPGDRNNILNKQEASLNSDKNVFISEYRFNVEGVGYRNLYDRCYIVRNKEGKAVRMMGSMMDITEQKQIEDELRKSKERYQSLIEQASDYIMITDTKGNFTDVNSSLCKAFGYSKEELLGMTINDIIDPVQLKTDPIRFDLLRDGKTILRERRMMSKDGTIIDVEANVKLLPDGRVLAIARNIEERKKAEEALAESENRLRTIVQAEPECVKLLKANCELEDMNPAGLKMIEADSIDDVKGKSVLGIIDKRYQKEFEELTHNIFKGRSGTLEFEITGLKGTKRWLETHAVPLKDTEGNIIFALGVTRDVTERKKVQQLVIKEKELSDSIINSMPGVFYLFDETGKYLRWNRFKEIITGYTHEEMQNMSPLDFFEGREKDYVKKHIEECFRTGETNLEASLVTKEGKKVPFFFTGISLEYEGKRCLLGTGIDITDRKKAEEEVQQSYASIRKLTEHLQNIREEERTHIAREIHDELGQQLTVLKMDASWLNKKLITNDESVKEKLKDLLELLDGTVRTVRKISSELRPSLLDDMGLVAAMEWHLKEFEKRVTVKTKFSMPTNDLPLTDTVKTGLFRIFQESLTNVARHANAKKVEVSLQRQNGSIILSIKDDGKGFDREKAANKKTLGILGMEERSFMMGGSYQINSKPGKGTLVVVSVPYND